MGGTASVRYSDNTVLERTLNDLLNIKWDRVHIRAHHAEIKSVTGISSVKIPPKKIHGELSIRVVGTGVVCPVEHEMISDTDSPSHCVFIASTSDTPTFNDSAMLLYRRDGVETPTSSPPTRKLKITLKEIVDMSSQVDDLFKQLQDNAIQMSSAVLTQKLRHRGYKRRGSVEISKSHTESPNIYINQQIDLPMPHEGWVPILLTSERANVYMSVRTSFAEQMISSAEDIARVESKMTKHHIENLSGGHPALLRGISRGKAEHAVFWLHGMADAFHHPAAVNALLEEGYDVWELSLRRTGACRKEYPTSSLVDYHYEEDFQNYFEEIDKALLHIMTQGYKKLFSYSHSTGSSVLLDYINKTHRADSVFAGLIFNSPFLGWGSADGQVEALADHVMARAIDAGDISAKLVGGPAKASDDNFIAINPRLLRIHSLYGYDYRVRSISQEDISSAFKVANASMTSLFSGIPLGSSITHLPFLVMTSKQDHSLMSDDLLELSRKIGLRRTIIQLEFAEHDMIASYDEEKSIESLAHMLAWLRSQL